MSRAPHDPITFQTHETLRGHFRFKPQDLICLPDYLGLLCILSLTFYNCQHIDPVHDLLDSSYFIFFGALVNGIVFLFNFHIFIAMNAVDFCVLILYPLTLLNLTVSSKRFYSFILSSFGFHGI